MAKMKKKKCEKYKNVKTYFNPQIQKKPLLTSYIFLTISVKILLDIISGITL